jgi:hypothetical protein
VERKRPTEPRPLRLSIKDTELVLRGVACISAKYANSPLRGATNDSPAPTTLTGHYDEQFMKAVLQVGHAMYLRRASGGRFQSFSCFHLAACAFGVRVTLLRLRRGEITVQAKNPEASARRLLGRIENARRRARTAFIIERGAAAYQQRAEAWRLFIEWMRWYFLQGYGVSRKRHLPSVRKHQRHRIALLMEWAQSALTSRESVVPPEAELRRLIRMAVRYVRRRRTGFTNMLDLKRSRQETAIWLAKFIEIRIEKRNPTEEE